MIEQGTDEATETILRALDRAQSELEPGTETYRAATAAYAMFDSLTRDAYEASGTDHQIAFLHLATILAAANALIANGVVVRFTAEDYRAMALAMDMLASQRPEEAT